MRAAPGQHQVRVRVTFKDATHAKTMTSRLSRLRRRAAAAASRPIHVHGMTSGRKSAPSPSGPSRRGSALALTLIAVAAGCGLLAPGGGRRFSGAGQPAARRDPPRPRRAGRAERPLAPHRSRRCPPAADRVAHRPSRPRPGEPSPQAAPGSGSACRDGPTGTPAGSRPDGRGSPQPPGASWSSSPRAGSPSTAAVTLPAASGRSSAARRRRPRGLLLRRGGPGALLLGTWRARSPWQPAPGRTSSRNSREAQGRSACTAPTASAARPARRSSHGCIRLPTRAITWLARRIGAGVPLTIEG